MADLLTYKQLCQQNKRLFDELEKNTLLIEYCRNRDEPTDELEKRRVVLQTLINLNMDKLEVMIKTQRSSDRQHEERERLEKAFQAGEYYYQLDEFSRHFHPYHSPKKNYFRRARRHF